MSFTGLEFENQQINMLQYQTQGNSIYNINFKVTFNPKLTAIIKVKQSQKEGKLIRGPLEESIEASAYTLSGIHYTASIYYNEQWGVTFIRDVNVPETVEFITRFPCHHEDRGVCKKLRSQLTVNAWNYAVNAFKWKLDDIRCQINDSGLDRPRHGQLIVTIP